MNNKNTIQSNLTAILKPSPPDLRVILAKKKPVTSLNESVLFNAS
jgi:hypothetical protein